jgi:hypothetical protein
MTATMLKKLTGRSAFEQGVTEALALGRKLHELQSRGDALSAKGARLAALVGTEVPGEARVH